MAFLSILPPQFVLAAIFDIAKSAWFSLAPWLLMRINISVTSSIVSSLSNVMTPICRFLISMSCMSILFNSLPFISLFAVQQSFTNCHKSNVGLNTSAISAIHRLSLKIALSCTLNNSSSFSGLAKGLNAIFILFFSKFALITSKPMIAVINAVTRCCPSIIIFFPSERLPFFNFMLGLCEMMRYPVGYPV